MNGPTMSVYINGNLQKSNSLAEDIGNSASNFAIGTRGDLSPASTTTKAAVVSVYSRALTAAEIRQNYSAHASRFNQPAFPVTRSSSYPKNATELAAAGVTEDGVYWLHPDGAPAPFRVYIDFNTPNGPWVHVGTACGNTRGLWTYADTWRSRGQDSGNITLPYGTGTSSFNAGSFIYSKGTHVMIKHNQDGYVQASGFYNESWRDVYYFLNNKTAWPNYNSYERELTITTRGGVMATASNTTLGLGLIYGTEASATTITTYTHWYVWGFDAGGDTYAYLTTGTYGGNGLFSEADHGIGASENGPSEQAFPGDANATNAATNFDAGTNDVADSGATTTYDGRAFSLWIRN
jgi:hypothetical protein